MPSSSLFINGTVFSSSHHQEKEKKDFSMDHNLLLSEGFEMKGEKREILEGSRDLHEVRSLRDLRHSVWTLMYFLMPMKK